MRERFCRTTPLHVTIRTVASVRSLRQRDAYHAIRFALYTTFKRGDFRVCHLSIQSNHVHLVVEADSHERLARGMQGFQISAARQLNRALSRGGGAQRKGQVFADRYHASRLTSPRHTRNALHYVLCNWRKHGADRRSAGAAGRLDPFSSAMFFDGWSDEARPLFASRTLEPLPVALAHCWLLATGWRKAGLLSPLDRPGPAG